MSGSMTGMGRRELATGQRRVASGLLVVVAGAVVALVGWIVARPLAGIDLAVRMGASADEPQQVGAAAVLAVSLLAGLAAWAVLAVLERRTRRARRTWTVVALVVLALSLSGPIAGGVTAGDKAALVGLHLVLAAVLIPLLPRTPLRRGAAGDSAGRR